VTRVILSGMHSGTNPSPGLGIARSLRASPEDFHIVGLDYSPDSSGLHSVLLDERVLMPTWDEIDLDTWADQCMDLLNPGTFFVSSLDLEVRLIAERIHDHKYFLSPGQQALEWIVKPPARIAEKLGLNSAPALAYQNNDEEIADFIRGSQGGVWVKGQHYEAVRALGLAQALEAGQDIAATWGGPWHAERHISGQEAGIAFIAREGELVDCVHMRKSVLTATGKTWAGEVSDVAPSLCERLSEWVRECSWHGGGELELIENWAGGCTLMEVNPRLPAWIHGATVALRNLPAALLAGKAPVTRPGTGAGAGNFTRVVEEIPTCPAIGAPAFPWSPDEYMTASRKHPSGMPAVAQRGLTQVPLSRPSLEFHATPSSTPDIPLGDLFPPATTPWHHTDCTALGKQLEQVRNSLDDYQVEFAYSVKTNPDTRLLSEALRLGMSMEVISQDELRAAARAGATADRLILNGPAKWWPAPQDTVAARAIFVDSVPEFSVIDEIMSRGVRISTSILGLRLARSRMASRFGVQIDHDDDLLVALQHLKPLLQRLGCAWGVHFHSAQSVIGTEQWVNDCAATLRAVPVMESTLGKPPATLDFGGGWHAHDLRQLPAAMQEVCSATSGYLEAASLPWIFELGKSLVEPCGVLFTRVIVPPSRSGNIVVDAGLSDLPEGPYWPHPAHILHSGRLSRLPAGKGKILGRTCMERDVLARDLALQDLTVGDVIVLGRAGGYDASMCYPFGRGSHHGAGYADH
jgi:diaminopimelate decarboxylase